MENSNSSPSTSVKTSTQTSSESLEADFFLRPSYLEINLAALKHNLVQFQDYVGENTTVMPVLKANAYGHGLVECGKALQAAGAQRFAVALLQEGIKLRQSGVTVPILVFGGLDTSCIKYFVDYNLEMTASSVSKLEEIESVAKTVGKKARIHLKVDTGMNRIGMRPSTVNQLFERTLTCKNCEVVGVYSHFACGSDKDAGGEYSMNKLQLEQFLEALSFYEKRSIPFPLRHISATAGTLILKESHLDIVRPGIGIYGCVPSLDLKGILDLKPVLSLRSKIVFNKIVPRGDKVSYSHTWEAKEDSRVVTIPVGYGDGYLRSFSNKGQVIIRGKVYPVVGRVCMDQFMVSMGSDYALNSDEVTIIGESGGKVISVEQLAELAGIIPHEVVTMLGARLPRKYIG